MLRHLCLSLSGVFPLGLHTPCSWQRIPDLGSGVNPLNFNTTAASRGNGRAAGSGGIYTRFYSNYPTEQGTGFSLSGICITSTQKANSVCTLQCPTTSEGIKSKVRKAKRADKSPLSITGPNIKTNPYNCILFVRLDFYWEKILNVSSL